MTPSEKDWFRQLIYEATQKVGEEILAEEFKVSVGTIRRWVAGRSVPPEYSRKVIEGRVGALLKEANEKQKKEYFKELVSEVNAKLGPDAVCDLFSVSIPTVQRWIAGTHWIHPIMIDNAIVLLRDLLANKKAD